MRKPLGKKIWKIGCLQAYFRVSPMRKPMRTHTLPHEETHEENPGSSFCKAFLMRKPIGKLPQGFPHEETYRNPHEEKC